MGRGLQWFIAYGIVLIGLGVVSESLWFFIPTFLVATLVALAGIGADTIALQKRETS